MGVSIHQSHGNPAKLKNAWLDEQFQVVVSVPLLDEIAEVLARPRIRRTYAISDEEISELLHLLSTRALVVMPSGNLHLCRDPDGDVMLETALLGAAQYAVSRDDDFKRDQDLMTHMHAHGVAVVPCSNSLTRSSRAPDFLFLTLTISCAPIII